MLSMIKSVGKTSSVIPGGLFVQIKAALALMGLVLLQLRKEKGLKSFCGIYPVNCKRGVTEPNRYGEL